MNPRVTDNDRDEITITMDGKELRGWSYSSEQERRVKMLCAREFVEGFGTGVGNWTPDPSVDHGDDPSESDAHADAMVATRKFEENR
jgi:hypothetical protein